MKFGTLDFRDIADDKTLVAEPVYRLIEDASLSDIHVSAINPELSDTAQFCEHYKIGPGEGANCVIIEARRADRIWYAACMILGTDRVDINGAVRRYLDARKVSFASMSDATSLTGMEYGGITPIGLPGDWPILVDTRVANAGRVIIGSGIRRSKLLVPGSLLAGLPNAVELDIAKV
ncbi:MAG TPA: YbaK/EbsC family protein [Candidatus Saccharimonadales bacterium]|jgi:prolyl-tRNA editing enzyme YbaK/EbsC (Cys-tRNA(Pro) deacylase)